MDQLNASLLSVKGEYKEKINKRLDLSVSHIRGIRPHFNGNNKNPKTIKGMVSKEEHQHVVQELERTKKTRDMFMKEL